jgi:hypothetical protein
MSKTSCVQLALIISGALPINACMAETDQPPPVVGETAAALFNDTEGCNDDQIHTIEQAQGYAAFSLITVMNDLGSIANGGDTSRFDYWFGAHGDFELSTVNATFEQIIEYFNTATYVCGCPGEPPSVIAQTTIGDPARKIRLCDAYFQGDYEEVQVGALFHEASHLAGTQHWIDGTCIEGDPFGWPESIHLAAQGQGGSTFAVISAEPYRLYALDWEPGRKSSFDGGCSD